MLWLLTVWILVADDSKLWLEQVYASEAECQRWLEFYREYPFRPQCRAIGKNNEQSN